jgi:WD40 repeat protein
MSGAVCLWDLKKKVRARQFFHEGQPSLQVSLDRTDTYVLSLSSRSLRSYKLREGVPAISWTPQGNYDFTKFACSTMEPQLVAIGTDDGSVLLYDITNPQSSQTILTLNQRHNSLITGIAFSYTNDKLLASTSQDGSLQFFDKGSGALIQELVRLPNCITSLALNADGFSCAIGTDEGEVLIYDLRRAGSDLASIHVQRAVRSLQFSPPPKNKNVPSAPTSSLNRIVSSTPDSRTESSSKPGLLSTPAQHEQQNIHRRSSSLASDRPRTTYQGPFEASLGPPTHQVISTGHGGSQPKSRSDSTYGGTESLPTYYTSGDGAVETTSTSAAVRLEDIRDVIRDEIEKLQDELEESLRNLHMDMIKQFHQQSEEFNMALASQLAAKEQLREENDRLREENDFLKRLQEQNVGAPRERNLLR